MLNHSAFKGVFSDFLRDKIFKYSEHGLHRVYVEGHDDFFLDLVGLKRRHKEARDEQFQDLDKHYETIFSGCSETYGDFIDRDLSAANDYVWGTIVSNYLETKSANLAMGGASAISILDDYLYQIKNYGPPKNFFVLYPRIDCRLPFIEDPGYLINFKGDDEHSYPSEFEIFNAVNIGIYENEQKISKRPHAIQKVLARPYVTYLNLQAILNAEVLCKLTGTNFIYSSWSIETTSIIEASNEAAKFLNLEVPFKNYIKIDYEMIDTDYDQGAMSIPKDCHKELNNHPNFYMGEENSHMGVHAHAHVAKNFIDELTKRGYTATL